jgi:hypothetical protein
MNENIHSLRISLWKSEIPHFLIRVCLRIERNNENQKEYSLVGEYEFYDI